MIKVTKTIVALFTVCLLALAVTAVPGMNKLSPVQEADAAVHVVVVFVVKAVIVTAAAIIAEKVVDYGCAKLTVTAKGSCYTKCICGFGGSQLTDQIVKFLAKQLKILPYGKAITATITIASTGSCVYSCAVTAK